MVWWYIIKSRVPCRKICLLSSRSRSQQGLVSLFLLYALNCWPCCNQNWLEGILICRTVVWKKKIITLFKVKVTMKMSMNVVQTKSSKLSNLLLPNLVEWFIIMSQSEKTGMLSSRLRSQWSFHIVKLWVFWTADVLQPNLVWWHKVDCLSKRLDCSVQVEQRFKISMNVHMDDLVATAETFVITKLVMVMQHRWPVSCEKIDLLFSKSRSQQG